MDGAARDGEALARASLSLDTVDFVSGHARQNLELLVKGHVEVRLIALSASVRLVLHLHFHPSAVRLRAGLTNEEARARYGVCKGLA